jgi:hypothetical protein
MPENNCHIQYASCLFIGVPLDESCRIVEGAPSIVTAGIGELSMEPERVDGTDYSAKNFGGVRCGPELRGPTIDKWGNIEGQVCLVDWTFQSATTGNPVVLDASGNVVGYQELTTVEDSACDLTPVPRLALAVIRRAATGDGGCSAPTESTGATPLALHVFPNTTDWKWTDSGWRDERNTRSFMAKGYSNPQIGAGPFNLWPATYTPNEVDPLAFHSEVFITGEGVPVASCNPVEHPAPDVRSA